VLFDVGLVKALGPELQDQFVDFSRCLVMGGPHDFLLHLKKFHSYVGEVDWEAMERDLTAFLGRFRQLSQGQLELGELFNSIYELARRYKVRPPPDFVLVMVGIVTAEGLGKQLDPHNNLFEAVAAYLMPLLSQKRAGAGEAGARSAQQ
jgi:ubiquinone biosynthesis protein